ncbi:MAG: HAD family phosphatase [Erysipelotrichaceae bacterium]|nr:HAD family phosphatase [Erysipelotrichaceae bacterium]
MGKKLQAVIFDMDGTMVDSETYYAKMVGEIVAQYGYTFSKEDTVRLYGCSIELENILIQGYLKQYTLEEIQVLKKTYFNEHPIDYSVSLNPGVRELVELLHENGIRMAICSSNEKQAVERMLRQTGLGKYISLISAKGDVKEEKPSPELYLHSLRQLNLEPEHVLVIEDSVYGVQSAINANLDVLAYCNAPVMLNYPEGTKKFPGYPEITDYIRTLL